MLKKAILFLCIMGISAFSFAGDNSSGAKVYAYYFHGSFRCPTCHKLELYSKEAIEFNFKDVLISGRLEFKTINVEERGNEHYVNDYQLYTKSLVLSLVRDGREVRFKNLTKIWECVGSRQRFYDYIKKEVTQFLKEL